MKYGQTWCKIVKDDDRGGVWDKTVQCSETWRDTGPALHQQQHHAQVMGKPADQAAVCVIVHVLVSSLAKHVCRQGGIGHGETGTGAGLEVHQ